MMHICPFTWVSKRRWTNAMYFKNNWASSYLNMASNMLFDAPSPLKSKVQETTFDNIQREDHDD
jgi:hypothetical protein